MTGYSSISNELKRIWQRIANFLVDSIQTRCIFDETLIIRNESRVYINQIKKNIDDNKISSCASLSLCSILLFFFPFSRHSYRFSSVTFRKRACTIPRIEETIRGGSGYLFLFLSFSFSPPLPVILVALSMDFNVDCNKLRPRERGSDGLKARELESPLFLPPSSSAFLNASQCSLLTMTNLPVLREN